MKYILNVAYSQQFNPIESVFSKVKGWFKKRRLFLLTSNSGVRFDLDKEI